MDVEAKTVSDHDMFGTGVITFTARLQNTFACPACARVRRVIWMTVAVFNLHVRVEAVVRQIRCGYHRIQREILSRKVATPTRGWGGCSPATPPIRRAGGGGGNARSVERGGCAPGTRE